VHTRHAKAKAKRASAAADAIPPTGNNVTVDATLDDQGDVEADTVENDGENNNATDLEGKVLAVDTAARTVTLSADDNDDVKDANVIVHIPASFDISSYHVGDEVQFRASPNADGSYTAVGSSHDGNENEADDASGEQGDNAEKD
jgi:hypothetical protein